MVATNQICIFFAVVQGKGKHALQVVEKFRPFFLIQREDHFTVRPCLELITIAIFSAQCLVVVDFTVYRQYVGFLLVVERLRPRVNVNN